LRDRHRRSLSLALTCKTPKKAADCLHVLIWSQLVAVLALCPQPVRHRCAPRQPSYFLLSLSLDVLNPESTHHHGLDRCCIDQHLHPPPPHPFNPASDLFLLLPSSIFHRRHCHHRRHHHH